LDFDIIQYQAQKLAAKKRIGVIRLLNNVSLTPPTLIMAPKGVHKGQSLGNSSAGPATPKKTPNVQASSSSESKKQVGFASIMSFKYALTISIKKESDRNA
jgi:hypothetical protein